jgi:two-component system cell cycle sensor histidine kinase PleC
MVTKAKQTNKKLVKDALDAEKTPRLVVDDNGYIIYASEAFLDMLKMSGKEVLKKPLIDVISFYEPDEVFRSVNLFSSVNESKWLDSLQEGIHSIKFKGKKNPEKFCFNKIYTGDKKAYLLAYHEKDKVNQKQFAPYVLEKITKLQDNKKTNKKQKINAESNEGELRHFLNMSNDLMSISSVDSHFMRVNNTFNEILGYEDKELRKMTFIDLVYADDRPHVRNSLYSMMHDESSEDQIIDFEARMIARDGTIKWMEWRQKRSQNLIYSVARDVTNIKKHETALRRQATQLSEAQAIGHMGHWYWKVGADDIEWSEEIFRIFGVHSKDFKPSLDNLNDMLHRRDIGRLLQAFQRAIIEKNNYDMEFRAIRPDGEIRYIRCEGKCEYDEDGDVIALFGIMQDITERTLHERDLREAKESAEQAYAAKTQFLANMSHELRTPLNAIIGFSEMMQRQLLGPIGTEKYLDYIAGIRESGEHLLDLISDILDMSKIEAGKYELDLEEVNVSKIIRLATHMMEGRALDSEIKISIDIKNEDLIIIADRRAIMQVILNLLSNAVKFTEPGGEVNIESIERTDYLSIKIHDTGIGIPANKLKTITQPFEQAASHYTRRHDGTGLGLSITKDLIDLHGGSLHIDSTVGIGTSVTVRLPYDAHKQIKRRKKQDYKQS